MLSVGYLFFCGVCLVRLGSVIILVSIIVVIVIGMIWLLFLYGWCIIGILSFERYFGVVCVIWCWWCFGLCLGFGRLIFCCLIMWRSWWRFVSCVRIFCLWSCILLYVGRLWRFVCCCSFRIGSILWRMMRCILFRIFWMCMLVVWVVCLLRFICFLLSILSWIVRWVFVWGLFFFNFSFEGGLVGEVV